MSPRDFLEEVVKPNMAEFEANFGDLRRATNAVASIDMLAAHLFDGLKHQHPPATTEPSDSSFRNSLAAASGDFRLIRDIAKAQKHVVLDKHSPTVSTSDQIRSREFGWGEGRWDSPLQVGVQLDNGEMRVVETVAKRAIVFLEGELSRHGL